MEDYPHVIMYRPRKDNAYADALSSISSCISMQLKTSTKPEYPYLVSSVSESKCYSVVPLTHSAIKRLTRRSDRLSDHFDTNKYNKVFVSRPVKMETPVTISSSRWCSLQTRYQILTILPVMALCPIKQPDHKFSDHRI